MNWRKRPTVAEALEQPISTLAVLRELLLAQRRLRNTGPSVTVFGSARVEPGGRVYEEARHLGRLLGGRGWTIVTGGGPGVMEAASRGAREAGGRTVGLNIELVPRQEPNPYLDQVFTFRHLFLRKTMLLSGARALVVFPGGFGTLDELFEAALLVQKRKLDTTIILVGGAFWQPVLQSLSDVLLSHAVIKNDDMGLLRLADSSDDVVKLLPHLPDNPAAETVRRDRLRQPGMSALSSLPAAA